MVLDVVTICLGHGTGRVGELPVDEERALELVRSEGGVSLGALEKDGLAGSEDRTGHGNNCEV